MTISIISSIIIWGCVLFIILRILASSGLCLPQNRIISFISDNKLIKNSYIPSKKELLGVFSAALAFRIIVLLMSASAIYMFSDNQASFTDFLNQYMEWDANNYIRIATGGYTYHVEEGVYTTLAFFPLYSWIMRFVNIVFHNLQFTGLLLSSLFYSGACVFLFKLFCMDYSKQTALRAIIYLSVFPHSLFFGTLMNESMLLITMSASLYFIRKHNWALAGILGALAALSRLVGILLVIPAAVEWFEHYKIIEKLKNKQIKEVFRIFYSKALWIFIIPTGLIIYLICNYAVTGHFFYFLELQEKIWNNGSEYFGKCISMIFEKAFTEHGMTKFAIWIPETLSIIFVVAALAYGLRRSRGMYLSFLAVYIIVNAGFKWPISISRYMTCAIPSFLYLSVFSERHKWIEPLITVSMAIGFGIYFTAYFASKQIL